MIKIINQMINNINKTIAILIAVAFLTPAVTFAEPSVSDSGSSAAAVTVSVPRVTDSGNSSVSVSVSVPSTTDSGNSAVSAPSTTNQGNSGTTASVSTPSTTDQGNSAVSSSNTSTPSTTDQGNSAVSSNPNTSSSSNGGSSSRSNGGSSSRSGGRSGSVSYVAGIPVNNSGCPYITSYMKMDNVNDSTQVTKLQTFLKINERLNLDINGKFDKKTHDAVMAFQTKYANDILLPWGGAKATGHVFYTTQKKINELVCKTPVTLTSGQLKAIEAFKSGKNEEAVKAETANGDIIINSDSNSSSTPVVVPEVGKNTSTSDTQTASAVKVSVGSKVWSFVKWLFGYNK